MEENITHPCLCNKCVRDRDNRIALAKEGLLIDLEILFKRVIDDKTTLQKFEEVFRIARKNVNLKESK